MYAWQIMLHNVEYLMKREYLFDAAAPSRIHNVLLRSEERVLLSPLSLT